VKIIEAIFEESLQASVNAAGNVEFGNSDAEFTPVDILKSDPIAYRTEYRAWLNDVWLAGHRVRLARILSLHGNQKRYKDLCTSVEANNIVPMVGSGMSKASGLPMWQEFLHQLRDYSGVSADELYALLEAGKYEEAVDLHADRMGRPLFDERIEHGLRVEDSTTLSGPVRLLPEVFPNLALTTNLDDVLENVYEASGRRFVQLLAGRDIERYRQLHASGRTTLLKLHGDCRRDDGRVLCVAEYNQAYADGAPCREALALIYRTRPLLWLGCSLSLDRTVKLVGEVAVADSRIPRHFAFLQLPTDDAVRIERERELSQRYIFPIWYDGDHDESIETLLIGILDHLGRFASGD
jgi:hypothetical protein